MLFSLTTQELMERPDLWEAVHRLRYKIFVEEMGWEDLRRPDGLECDQFDHDEAVHQIVIRGSEVAGYQRLLPTTRGHLLTEVLTDLFEGTPPSGPNIYELTRYAVGRAMQLHTMASNTIDHIVLTPRERECLQWAAVGKSEWEISQILGISEHTSEKHLLNAKSNLGAVNRVQAVAEAIRRGYIS